MPNKVAELYADFKVNFEKATLDVVNTTLGEMRLSTIAEIATLAGLTRALYNLGTSAVATASEYHMLGEVYGINATQLQRMEYAGVAANVGVDKMRASVLGLQQNLAGLNLGQINAGFLEAAGFFGLNVHPGTNSDQMMDQLFKKVPQFVKAHGQMGRAMASSLLGQMGVAPEMLQYILAGKKTGAGTVMRSPEVEALTKVNESLGVLSRNLEFLAYKAIGPLVEELLPISEWFLTSAGGLSNITHPLRTVEGLAAAFKGRLQATYYETAAEQKLHSADALARHRGVLPLSPYVSSSLHPGVLSSMLAPHQAGGTSIKQETEINVYGVEDHKIAGAVKRAAAQASEKTKRDYAMHTAINNPVGQ
ncbi:MAG: hypothetical protein PHS14_00225 [Elusimicrobia bacterium]|nr:hypothetical protein [Elusimicrobiota bacterium]